MLQYYALFEFVITGRLHVTLPCVALGTPVLFLPRDVTDHRFDGLSTLVNIVPLTAAMEDEKLLDPSRWPVRTDHRNLRNDLIGAVRHFAAR